MGFLNKIYSCEIITPLIMKGAKKRLEIRTQEIIGILRWWYRFYKAGEVRNLEELKEEEGKVWGSQERAKQFQIRIEKLPEEFIEDAYLCMNDKEKIIIKLKNGKTKRILKRDLNKYKHQVVDFSEIKTFAYSPKDGNSLTITFKKVKESNIVSDINKTWTFLSLFGGLGARWRRGFSSIMWKEVKIKGNSLSEIKKEIESKLGRSLVKPSSDKKLDEFLNIKNTEIYLLIKSQKDFWNDWEEAMNNLRDNFYRKLKRKLDVIALTETVNKSNSRSFSPLIIQIKKTEEGKYFGVILVWKIWRKFKDFNDFVNFEVVKNFEIEKVRLT